MNLFEKEQQIIQWLREYESLKAGVIYLGESIADIAEAGMGLAYDKDQISKTNKFSSVVETATIKIDKLNITTRIKTMTNVIHAIDVALENLSEVEKTVLVSRCIQGQYYYQFCGKIHCSERTARRIKRMALNKMVVIIFGIE